MRLQRPVTFLVLQLLARILLSITPNRPLANVLPESTLLFHVEPTIEGACDAPLTDCHDITRYTDATGTVTFAAYLYPLAYVDDHLEVVSLHGTVTWPDSWTILDWAPCGEAVGNFVTSGNTGVLDLSWPSHPQFTDDLMLAAVFEVDVDGYGEFDLANRADLELGWPDPFVVRTVGIDAQADAACSHCGILCAAGEYCRPTLDTSALELMVEEGQTTTGEIAATAYSAIGPQYPCELECTGTEPWLSAAVVEFAYPYYLVEVTADATGRSGSKRGGPRPFDSSTGCSRSFAPCTGWPN